MKTYCTEYNDTNGNSNTFIGTKHQAKKLDIWKKIKGEIK
jgi:hypothetical protein